MTLTNGSSSGPAAEPDDLAQPTAAAIPAPVATTAPVTTTAPPVTAQRPSRATRVVAIAGAFLALLDTTVVNVSLNATSARFGDIGHVQWVLTAYLLALAATMPATAWLANRFGPKRVFLGSVAVFVAGSAACAVSPTLAALVVGRGVAGAAAGVLTPVATILLTRGVPREQLGRVQALNGSVMLIGPLLGPTIGGLLVQAWGWSAVYAVNIPLCLVIFVVGLRRVAPDASGERLTRPLDVVGLLSAVLCTVPVVLAIGGVSHGGSLTSMAFVLPLAVAAVAAVVFVARERRARFPLLDLRLFNNSVYGMAALNVAFLGFVLYGPMVLIPLYFEAARGETAIVTGLLLSTGGVGVVFAGWLCRRLLRRLGGGLTMIIGIALTLGATLPMTMLSSDTSYVLLCASMVVRGAGTGLTIVPAMTRAFESIPARSIPDASSQLNLLQRIGGTVAAAMMIVVLQRQAVLNHGLGPVAFAHAFVWLLATSAVTLVPALALLLAERREPRQT